MVREEGREGLPRMTEGRRVPRMGGQKGMHVEGRKGGGEERRKEERRKEVENRRVEERSKGKGRTIKLDKGKKSAKKGRMGGQRGRTASRREERKREGKNGRV